jgi:hypothetical protein
MKVRSGFVSNSSSSSFVVVFDKKPKSKGELFKLMFGDKDLDDHINYYDDICHLSEVVEHVYQQLQLQEKSAVIKDVSEKLRSRYHYGWLSKNSGTITREGRLVHGPKWHLDDKESNYCGTNKKDLEILIDLMKKQDQLSYDESTDKDRQKLYDDIDKLVKKISMNDARQFIKDHKGKFVALFEFEDHTTIGSVCEHGGIFDKSELFHIISSNH